MVMPGPEIGISRHLFLSSGSYILSAPSLSKKKYYFSDFIHSQHPMSSFCSLPGYTSFTCIFIHSWLERTSAHRTLLSIPLNQALKPWAFLALFSLIPVLLLVNVGAVFLITQSWNLNISLGIHHLCICCDIYRALKHLWSWHPPFSPLWFSWISHHWPLPRSIIFKVLCHVVTR